MAGISSEPQYLENKQFFLLSKIQAIPSHTNLLIVE